MITKKQLIKELRKNVQEMYAIEIEDATEQELFFSLGTTIKGIYNKNWRKTWNN